MQTWNIGGGLQNRDFLLKFFNTISGSPIMDEYSFSVFDCPPELIWQGGRLSKPITLSDEETLVILRKYNKLGVGVNLVFSNGLIGEQELEDKRGNWYLEQLHDERNGVITKSRFLAEYIRKNYPKYKITLSMTHGRKLDIDQYKEAVRLYDVVVLSNEQLDDEFLQNFTFEERGKMEVLVNENCFSGCPYRCMHYQAIDEANMYGHEEDANICRKMCSLNKRGLISNPLSFKSSNVPYDRVMELRKMGFTRWKLAGRTADPTMKISPLFLDNFSNYLLRDLGIDSAFTYIYLLDNSDILKDEMEVREWIKRAYQG